MISRQAELAILIVAGVGVMIAGTLLVLNVGWRSLLPPQRWRKLPNLGTYCWVLFFAFWILTPFVVTWLIGSGSSAFEDAILAGLVGSLIAFPLQMMVVAWAAWTFLGASWRVGLPTRQRLWPAIAAGFVTWLAFYPPTQGINLVVREIVTRWAEGPKISNHPLIEALQKSDSSNIYWILITIESILLAPVREELFFRGALQPWLIRQKFGGLIGLAFALLAGVSMRGDVVGFWNRMGPPLFALLMGGGLFALQPIIVRMRDRFGAVGQYLVPTVHAGPLAGQMVYRGVVSTSMLFAMFHSSSWPDPIPLTILGFGLGWLAWRTQGVIGPIVCHSLFNAMTIFQLRIMLPSVS